MSLLSSRDSSRVTPSLLQSRYLDLMQLGLQLFSKPFAALPSNTAPPAAHNGTCSGGTTGQPSPMLACAMDCVASCLAGKGTAGALATSSGGTAAGAPGTEGFAVKQEHAAPQAPSPAS